MTEKRLIQILITACALGTVVLHNLNKVNIDNQTLLLLSLAAIPWMAPLIKAIKIPGVGEVEFKELKDEVTKVSGIANHANQNASLAIEELNQIAIFVFKSLINKGEIEILNRLKNEAPYEIGRLDEKIADQLYQLRDSELIIMGSISRLEGKIVNNLHDFARISDSGLRYLEFLKKIEKTQSNNPLAADARISRG